MEPAVQRGRRWLMAWVALLLALIAVTRLAVVFLAANGREGLPSQLVVDAIAAAVVLYVAFSGDRVAKWLGALLFTVWGLGSLYVATFLGAAMTFSLRGEVVFLLAAGVWGAVVQALALVTAVVYLGVAAALTASPSINRYLASRRRQSAQLGAAPDRGRV